jgi:hypothetical protein
MNKITILAGVFLLALCPTIQTEVIQGAALQHSYGKQ